MKKALCILRIMAALVLLPVMLVQQSFAWGMDGHMMINRIAGANLPADVPAFLRSPAALDALEYYGPEPDRWRSPAEPELSAAQAPEHFIDLEYADLAGPLPRRRYDYIRALVAAKKDTKPSECEITFLAGWLGHYVADGSQPLHTSIQYNGWVGPNPNGYTTEHQIHALFESTYVHANVKPGDFAPLVAAAKPVVMGDVFNEYMAYLRHSNSLVEQTYQLDKTGAFTGAGTPAGKAFVDRQLAAGAVELRDMIYTAWIKSAEPVPAYRGN